MDLKEDSNHCENEPFAPEYRDRLRTWLEKMINSGSIPGLCWENKERTIFRMPWKHAGRQDYNLEEDSKIFMAWAVHSGRYREGIDKPEPIVWKTRLRCALNKMPDIRELPERSRLDISEPYRVYQLLPPVHKASQIRRRLYKRSQSHESDQPKQLGDHARPISLTGSPQKEDNEWESDLSFQRRNSSTETSRFGISKQQRSPLTSVASTVASPRFWLPPSVTLPIKPPMSANLSNGLHVPQPITIDPSTTLQTLAHQRYPLVSSLHNPFAAGFASSALPFFPTTASLETFKRFGLGDHSIFTRQKYHEHLSNIARKLEQSNQSTAERSRVYSVETNSDKQHLTDQKYSSDEGSNKFHSTKKQKEPERQASPESNTSHRRFLTEQTVQFQLRKCQMKIESLEKDLDKARNAHAQEKKARRELEKEKETMKMALERMGENLRSLAAHFHPREEKILEQFRKDYFQDQQTTSSMSQSDEESTRINAATSSPRSLSPSPSHETDNFVPDEAVVNTKERAVYSQLTAKQKLFKRANSPLDLTVHSPGKKPRTSHDDDTDLSGLPLKTSPGFATNAFVTPFSDREAPEDKCGTRSPSSLCSGSPDSVTPSGDGEGRGNFGGHSPSPLQRALHYPQRHNTIQVT